MKKIVTRYGLLSIIISFLMSACGVEEIDGGDESKGGGIIGSRATLSFGKEYDIIDENGINIHGHCYAIVNAEANRLELKMCDPFNDYLPIENYVVIGVSIYYDIVGEFTGAYKTIDEIRPLFDTDFANGFEELDDPDSFAHADLGEGKTHHHIHNWFNIQKVDGDDEKIIITIPANDTGHVRGFRLLAGKDMGYGWDVCELEVYQCPQETESIADMEEFPMSIRYKGKIYTTMATIDENDEYH
ncbi:MAG: hypothetical protein K2I91_06215, partial [Muribaculaceae bacterium]|nr:hypothetical protein [Muribaculaceae bacterium]